MADALLGVVTEAVLTNAISLANEWLSGVLGVKEDLQSLAETLELIQALLSDAESKSTTNKTIEVWLKRLTDAAADADDLLDEFAYQVLSKKMLKGKRNKVRSFFSSSNPLMFRSKMASEIKKINLQMKEILENANQIGLIMNSPTDPRKVQPTARFVDDSKIVGRGNDVSKIVRQLTCSEDEKDLSVIGVVGMGGQGKTTVAQLLMKNDEVNKHFERTVWTCVSDDFDVDRVLNDMLQFLTRKESKLTNRDEIVRQLSEALKGKRFLLVLDDVWNENSQLWDNMNDSLQAIGGSKGSKIIVTTRNDVVVTKMNGFVHRLGVLSGEDSQELFEKMAFGNDRAAKNPRLVEIGKRIVARCGGVPLALKAIGGLLSSQRDELEWLKIEESSTWLSTLDGVQSAIKLSFDHLPYLSLKKCFAYCSVFPKDSVIKKNVTIQQWMALGLLNPSSGSDLKMEDIGNNYFKILLQGSLLQEAEFDECGNITSCKMHDLVHDFALKASKEHCLTAKVGELSDDIKALHLSIVRDGSDNLNISSEKKFSKLRTLHLHDGVSSKNFLVHCKCLRVLTLADRGMRELPISIAKMKHLRYLDIFGTCIQALPEFISKLYNLQTLRLPEPMNLPKDFVRLVKLRHLDIKDLSYTDIVPRHPFTPGIGEMTSLRTLNWFRVSRKEGCQIKELCNLKHLEGTLTIYGLENVANKDDARRANLSGKRNIESLELHWSSTYNTEGSRNDESILEGLQPHPCLKALRIESFMGKSLPSWILPLHNMTRLNLVDLENCEQIPPLGHLPFLEVLGLDGMKSVKCIGNNFYGWVNPNLKSADSVVVFPSLKELWVSDMDSLEEWSDVIQPSFVSSSSSSVKLFPNLEKFEIYCCYCLTHLPEGLLRASTGLESLKIKDCSKLVSIPDLSSAHNLTRVILKDLENCKQIPPLGHLPFLEILEIDKMKSVKCIGNDFYGWVNLNLESADSNETSIVVFPSLKELSIEDMPNLEEWSDMVQPSFFSSSSSSSVELFPSLEKFEITRCANLTCLPDGLLSASTGLKSLLIKMCDEMVSIPDLSSFRSLKDLDIYDCWKSSALSCGIEACRSLQILRITCSASVMENLHYLTNLRELTLRLSNNIIDHHVPMRPVSNTAADDIQGHDGRPFSTLEYLELNGMWMPQFKSLPEQIQRFTALTSLELVGFNGLETLPEWLGNFHSLESLQLLNCASLANFPSMKVMRGLTNLKSLTIGGCPILELRCLIKGGAECHKIANIPHIY